MTHPSAVLATGEILDGRFLIVETLSEGGLSTVFKAIDTVSGRHVVIKVPPRHLIELHRREARIGHSLSHPGILRFIDVDESARSRPYLVTEYLEGHSLRHELQARGALPPATAMKLAGQVCDALAYLHERQIIHGDITPANLMLCPDGSVHIIDFGVARWAGRTWLPFSRYVSHVGTPEYMAPEQVKGSRSDGRMDLYALGAVLYEMVTGRRPFDAEPEEWRLQARVVGDPVAPSDYASDLPPQIEEIILHALARRPGDRYGSASEMRADLEAPDQVRLTGRAARLRPPVMSRMWWPAVRLAGLSLLALVAMFLLFLAILNR